MNPWSLPVKVEIGGVTYGIHADYRDILDIIGYLNNRKEPEFIRWLVALALFYDKEIPQGNQVDAMEYLIQFINCGKAEDPTPAPQLLDWELDAQAIVADVNKGAGFGVRSVPFLHWWTFVSYFSAIGEGQLSMLVSIRDKLHRNKKLEKWEMEYYKKNRNAVDLPCRNIPVDQTGQDWLDRLAGK